MNTTSPFDELVEQARTALDTANAEYNACLDRLSARTEADDDLEEVQQLWRDVQVGCYRAELTLAAFEEFVGAWHICRAQRPDVSEDELLEAFRRRLTQ